MRTRTPGRLWRSLAVIFVAASLVFAPRAAAQDTQYWSDAFGMQARLLGGVVIGSDEDVSAVYYNPGAIALADSLQFLISLNALRYAQIGFSVPSVPSVPASTGWSAVSNMFAGTLPIGGRDTHQRLAYSLLTRQSFTFGAQLRDLPLDSFAPIPPPAPFTSVGNALISQSLSETWAGLTYSKEKAGHWGFGASLFIPIRSQTWSQSVSAQVVNALGQTALAMKEYDFSFSSWSLLLKLGAQYRAEHWSAGMTVTTPRVNLFGSGDVGATRSYIDQGVVGGAGSSQIATNYQSNLSATYHSALSVGAGYGYHWTNTRLDISAEWFAAVSEFTLLPATSFTPQTGGDTITMALTAKYRSLINYGIGVQHRFSPRWNLYGAFRTDKTSIPEGAKSVGTLVNWDLYHANFGVQATIGRAAVILGLDTAWGSKPAQSATGTPAPGLPKLPVVDESFFSLTGALGFRISF